MISLTTPSDDVYYAVDPKPYEDVLQREFNEHRWLPYVNTMELRCDGVMGKGYILLDTTDYELLKDSTYITLTFDNDGTTITLKTYILDAVELDLSDNPMVVIILQEERACLLQHVLEDDYNVIDYNTFVDYNNFKVLQAQTLRGSLYPSLPYTWNAIIGLIADVASVTPSIESGAFPNVYPYNVFLQGLTVFDALHYICNQFALGFNVSGNTLNIFRREGVPPSHFKNMERTVGATSESISRLPSFNINFPTLSQHADNQLVRDRYHDLENAANQSTPGYNVDVYCMYHPYIVGPSGNNAGTISSIKNFVRDSYEQSYINRASRYTSDVLTPDPYDIRFDSVIYYDDGYRIGTEILNAEIDAPASPPSPESSQSIEPFKFKITTVYDPEDDTAGKVEITNPVTGAVWATNVPMINILSLGGTFIGQPVDYVGYGVRVGLQRYILGAGGEADFILFELTTDLIPGLGNTANATVSGDPVAVINTGYWRGFTGAIGMALVKGGLNYVIWVQSPAIQVYAVLDAHPSSSAGANYKFGADPRYSTAYIKTAGVIKALSPFPFTWIDGLNDGQVANPHKLLGEDGDGVILTWDETLVEFVVTQILPQRSLSLWATLNVGDTVSPARNGGLFKNMACLSLMPDSGGPFPATPNAKDIFNKAIQMRENTVGVVPDRMLIKWDPMYQQYIVLEAEHMATWFKGTVATFSGTPATLTVTPTGGYDGDLTNIGSTVTVANRYKWVSGGGSTKMIDVHWDPVAKEYYPLQMECP